MFFEATIIYINFDEDLKVVLTSVNISQVQQLIKKAIKKQLLIRFFKK